MSDQLSLNFKGPNNPTVVRYTNGITQDTQGLGALPGASTEINAALTTVDQATNRVVQLGHRVLAAVGDDVWQKDGAGSFVAQGLALPVNPTATTQVRRSGWFEFMHTTLGPGALFFYPRSDGNIGVVEYYFLTDSYVVRDLGVTSNSGLRTHVWTGWFEGPTFVGSTTDGIIFYNVDTQAFSRGDPPNSPPNGGFPFVICSQGINVYALAHVDNDVTDGPVGLFLRVGSAWALLDTLTGVVASDNIDRRDQGSLCIYEKGGQIYQVAMTDPGPNGHRLFRYDPVSGINTDVSGSEFSALLAPGGGLTGNGGASDDRRKRFIVRKDVETPFGSERILIQVFFGPENELSAVFEHTTQWVFVGSSQWAGNFCSVQGSYGSSGYYFTNGELSAVFTSPPVPAPNGVQLNFRVFGDPGNANKVVRVRYSQPLQGPVDQADLSAPGGGTGGGSSISGGDSLINVDADGEASATNYQVIHETLAQGVPASTPLHWFLEVNTA